MADSLSRRNFLTGLGGAVVAASVPTSVQSATPQAAGSPAPATPEDPLLAAAKASSKATATARLRFKLPENSEPCFVFPVTPVSERKR